MKHADIMAADLEAADNRLRRRVLERMPSPAVLALCRSLERELARRGLPKPGPLGTRGLPTVRR